MNSIKLTQAASEQFTRYGTASGPPSDVIRFVVANNLTMRSWSLAADPDTMHLGFLNDEQTECFRAGMPHVIAA